MAAGLGFKDFQTGEVLTAADVDGYLMQGVWVFADATARDAAVTSPQEGNFAYLKDTNVTTYYTGSAWANLDTTGMTNPMTTTGDVIYSSSGSTPARLGIGTAGQVLKVNSGATAPEWGTVGGGGKVLQVVSTTYSTEKTNTTVNYADTDLTLSITPSSATSTILVMVSQLIYCERNSDNAGVGMRLLRGATTIMTQSGDNYSTWMNITSGSNPQSGGVSSIIYLDSPATTSSTTYKTQFKAHFGSNTTAKAQPSGGTSTITLLEIGA